MRRLLALPILWLLLSAAASAAGSARDAAVEAHIEALVQRMTLEEKIGQLHLTSRGDDMEGALGGVRKGRIGNLMNVPAAPDIARFRQAARESRLAIPLLFG